MIFWLLASISLFNVIKCSKSESFEVNQLEWSPMYDTIILNDITDIINEIENNVNWPGDPFIHNSIDSENIDDLLSQYQHYLEKAHKDRKNYVNKKYKNKIPLLRHDRYFKSKYNVGIKNDNSYNWNNLNNVKFPQTPDNYYNPLDIFAPMETKVEYLNNPDIITNEPKSNQNEPTFETVFSSEKRLDLPAVIRKSVSDPIESPCLCKYGQFPCKCNCKQCLVTLKNTKKIYNERQMTHADKLLPQNSLHFDNNRKNALTKNSHDALENTLNIRIKIDVQLPSNQENLKESYGKNRIAKENKEEIGVAKILATPFFNIPIPSEWSGYKMTSEFNKHIASPIHKLIIHKKKKSRPSNNSNKKQRKKAITFHNNYIKLEPKKSESPMSFTKENFNITDYSQKSKYINESSVPSNTLSIVSNSNLASDNETTDTMVVNGTETEKNLYIMTNTTNNNDSEAENLHITQNSIETEYTTTHLNFTTENPQLNNIVRMKRDVFLPKTDLISTIITKDVLTKSKLAKKYDSSNIKENTKAKPSDKGLLTDAELLYWPSNVTQNNFYSKNITTLILERENKKAKVNLTKETIRHNHIEALEKAIFGDVDWDDVDTVVPVFMSFVGKYMTGVLTFCSKSICHSMKCAEKHCVHRVCKAEDRLNKRGHCIGSNNTDSVASMESIMDLPSNIALEIVDILQDKMLGKIFGKATLCIGSKCVTLLACKKNFLHSKCTSKELKNGYCTNVKM